MKVAVHTLGCKVNQYESDAMIKLFTDRGYELTDSVADVYLINTCTVTSLSASKSRQFISRAKKENPQAIVAAVGCYPQTEPEKISALGVDVLIGSQGRDQIVDLCERAMGKPGQINLVEGFDRQEDFEELKVEENYDMTRAYLKVQEGCNQFCSYCIIPYARGPIRSRAFSNSVEEARRLVDNGYKEIVVTGIHVASYGLDLQEDYRLVDLLEALAGIEGLARIRLSSIEPRIIDEDLLARLSSLQAFCDHFHLSLQSGSDKILKRMGRRYDRAMYLEKIGLIREYFPNAGLTTDIMVGFPSETDQDFQDSLDLVDRVNFSNIHVFRYSPRKGTPAASFKDQVDGGVKKDRAQALRDLADKSQQAFLDSQIGRQLDVLFEKDQDGVSSGTTSNYLNVIVKNHDNLEGQLKSVIIRGIEDKSLIGELL